MKIRIRLYHYHDLDLVSLYREGRISIPKAVKFTLNAFARKCYVRLETVDKKCEKIAKPVYMFNIILDEKKDKDAIDLLNKIDKGYRNNFIKQLLRVYLCFVLPGCYTAQENLGYFSEREKGIFGEREVVPAPVSRYVREKTSEQKRVAESPIEVGGVVIKDLPPEKPEDSSVPETKDSFENSIEVETDPLKESPNESLEPEIQEDTSLQNSLNDELAETGNSNDEEESELMGLFKNMVI